LRLLHQQVLIESNGDVQEVRSVRLSHVIFSDHLVSVF